MHKFILFSLFLLVFAFPCHAASGGFVVDGIIQGSDPAAPLAPVDPSDPESTQEGSEDPAALAGSDPFTGGYWFVCDCSLGYDLKFYVPAEWSTDLFTLDSSGAPVNVSNSTVYAYCDSFPEYTFSASRYGRFVYRGSNYNNVELNITRISDTNIDFLEDNPVRLSDQDFRVLACSLIFLVAAILIIRRG